MSAETSREGEAGTSTSKSEINVRYADKEYTDKKWLRYFIEEGGKDVQEIADDCDMSSTGILYHVRKHGIDTGHHCPECGSIHATEEGKKRHASMQHDINLRGHEEICKQCGGSFRAEAASSEIFCGSECHQKHESNRHAKKRPEVTCAHCGKTETVKPHREESHTYCSYTCRYEAQEVVFSGDGNPNWRGGYDSYYGPNWHPQRRKARIRDQSRCQLCGDTPLDTGEEINVHHLTRIAWYRDNFDAPEWYKRGNQLSNLLCLCRGCHPKWEGIPLRPI